MKRNITLFALIISLAVLQGCGSPSEKDKEAPTAEELEAAAADSVKQAVEERHAVRVKEWAEQAEKRKLAKEELAKTTPYFTTAAGKKIYNQSEIEPTFIGGKQAMVSYLNDNLIYPEDAKSEGLEGTVFVDFVVGMNGSVSDVTVENSYQEADPRFRDEAIRVITNMPAWTPGQQHGKAVDVKYSLPVTFQLL